MNMSLHSVAFYSICWNKYGSLASAVDRDEIFKAGALLPSIWRTVIGLKESLQPRGAIQVGTVWGDIQTSER